MPKDNGQGSEAPPARLKTRRQVRERLTEIKSYIDDQRGNDPEDQTGWKVLERIFNDLFHIRRWPYSSPQVPGLSYHYRKRRIANSYVLYYFVNEEENAIYVIDLRHGSQKPLKPSTVQRYKSDIEPD